MSKKTKNLLNILVSLEIILMSSLTSNYKIHRIKEYLSVIRYIYIKLYLEINLNDKNFLSTIYKKFTLLNFVKNFIYSLFFELELYLVKKNSYKKINPILTKRLLQISKLKYKKIQKYLREKKFKNYKNFSLLELYIFLFKSIN
jgi:hypothetical protein